MSNARLVGIRREDKSRWERRVPLTPEHVRRLIADEGVPVRVQPSPLRVFADDAYRAVGAEVAEDLSPCGVVLGVKEMPAEVFQPGTAYVFFSHTAKGQPYNMPMLARLLEQRAHLIDYERVADAAGRRLIFFGRHAGLAGALETLRALGLRLAWEGHETALGELRPAYELAEVENARAAVAGVRAAFDRDGIPEILQPLVIGVAGYGNVAKGVFDMLEPLRPVRLPPEELASATGHPDPARTVFVSVFEERHLAAPRDEAATFELQDYYDHPGRYRSRFGEYLPHLTVLINAIYWAPQYPRLVTREQVAELWSGENAPRLRVIGDITCDIAGSIECTVRATEPDVPSYVYLPETGETRDGVEGRGPVIMAVDILPCELPLEASRDFGDALLPLVAPLARADLDIGLDMAALPEEIARAVIAAGGELTPAYAYLQEALEEHGA